MNRMKTMLIIFVIFISINTSALAFATTGHDAKHFDIKVSIEGKAGYKGVVIGNLFLIKIEITNLTSNKYNIGDYFRVLMTMDETAWSQFTMAASGPTNLKAPVHRLKYGSGANSIAKLGEDKKSVEIQVGNSSIIHDSTVEKENINMSDWWPTYLPPKGSVIITWPTFWFSDSKDEPEFIATPSFSSKQEKYYCWVNFKNNETREILASTENLLKIIANKSEMIGLRSAAVRWLLESNDKNEKHLLRYLQEKNTLDALAYRSMQALMVWGSSKIIDDVFALWKKRKLLPSLDDKNMKYYFTWSSHKNADDYKKKVESGNR